MNVEIKYEDGSRFYVIDKINRIDSVLVNYHSVEKKDNKAVVYYCVRHGGLYKQDELYKTQEEVFDALREKYQETTREALKFFNEENK